MGEHMKMETTKAIFTAFLSSLLAYFNQLLIPICVLLVFMLLDYILGIAGAWKNSELSSKKGWNGIIKKVGYLAAICVGIGIDYIIFTFGEKIGVDIPFQNFIALLVCIWFILNEFISILENLNKMGVNVPPFVSGLIEHLKEKTEKQEKK